MGACLVKSYFSSQKNNKVYDEVISYDLDEELGIRREEIEVRSYSKLKSFYSFITSFGRRNTTDVSLNPIVSLTPKSKPSKNSKNNNNSDGNNKTNTTIPELKGHGLKRLETFIYYPSKEPKFDYFGALHTSLNTTREDYEFYNIPSPIVSPSTQVLTNLSSSLGQSHAISLTARSQTRRSTMINVREPMEFHDNPYRPTLRDNLNHEHNEEFIDTYGLE